MLTDRFDDALVYAARVHRDQLRKGSRVPYISHLLAVSSLTLEHGGDEEQAIAALLHDAAEDQGGVTRLKDIEGRYGERVAKIVADCTDTFDDPKPAWRPRKEAYIAALGRKHADSLLVSLADKTHNAEAIITDRLDAGEAIWSRFTGGRDGTIWYYGELSRAFEILMPCRLSRRFAAAVEAMGL